MMSLDFLLWRRYELYREVERRHVQHLPFQPGVEENIEVGNLSGIQATGIYRFQSSKIHEH